MKKILYVGWDVHKESIVVATAPEGDTPVELYGQIGGTLDALDKLIKKLEKPELELRFVYEAGPCGYVIYRHLTKRSYPCQVIAPSLIPTKASDRVKTDRRDARQLARLFRAGEWTAIDVPDEEDEAVRDLVRARELCGFVWAIACQVSAPEKVKRREQAVKETKPAAPKMTSVIKTSQTAATAKREYQLAAKKKFNK